jgi:SNF2 family DNA or RNA helicase
METQGPPTGSGPRILRLPGSESGTETPQAAVSYRDGKIIVKLPRYNPLFGTMAKNMGGRWKVDRTRLRDRPSTRELKRFGVPGWFEFPAYLCYAIWLEETPFFVSLEKDESYSAWRDAELEVLQDEDIPPSLLPVWQQLYGFQKEAVSMLVDNPWDHPGDLTALAPGLGKTVVALTTAGLLELPRVLIIAPLSLVNVWLLEKMKWFPGTRNSASLPYEINAVHGQSPPKEGWVVTNYNTVTSPRRVVDYIEQGWDAVVVDESVGVKNRRTQRFMSLKGLRESTDRWWELSGSPVTKHLDDLWAQFHLIEPRAHTKYSRFANRWCVVEENIWNKGHGGDVVGSAGRDVHRDFKDVLFVRSQEQVLPDLPEIRFEALNVSMTAQQSGIYEDMLQKFIATLESGEEMSTTNKLAQLIRLQQITSNPCNFGKNWPDTSGKHAALAELVEAEAVEFPMLVWTHWKRGSEALQRRLEGLIPGRVELIHGSIDKEEIDELFVDYKASKIDILICSLGVGKFGHTLVNTRTAVYVDKTWDADAWAQSLRRIKRIGLTHSPRCITITCPGTVDDMVEDNLAGKAVNIAHVTNSNLATMLKSLARGQGIDYSLFQPPRPTGESA